MYREASTLYFDRGGRANTDIILNAAVKRAQELEISYLVVASTTGATGLRTLDLAAEVGYRGHVVVVGQHHGFSEPGGQPMSAETRAELQRRGATLVVGTHALSSIARSFRLKHGGIDILETVAETLRCLSHGVKVTVECAIMAADAGAVPIDQDIVAVGGSGGGADSATVINPANMNRFLEMRIREIIGMPR